jgi:hypothetical protein
MEERSRGIVLMQSRRKGARQTKGMGMQYRERREGDKDIKEIKERKKQIIFPIIFEGSCASSNKTGRKF